MENFNENIEEFFKDALSDYEASYDPGDWDKMNEKLDNANLSGKPGGPGGLFKNPLMKLGLGALIVITGAYLIVTNNDDNSSTVSNIENTDADRISIFERITSVQNIDIEVQSPVSDKTQHQVSSTQKKQQDQVNNQHYFTGDDPMAEIKNDDYASQQYIAKKYDGPFWEMLINSYRKDEKQLPPPSAKFSADIIDGCVPLTVKFTAESKDLGLIYSWNFGDGISDYEEDPMHIYLKDGNYDVALTVTSTVDEKSETNLEKGFISVFSLPEVSISGIETEDEVVVGNEVVFLESSKGVVEWQWFFGDEEFSNMQNPLHSYSEPGQYSVVLVGKSSYGCMDTAVSTIFIMGKDLGVKIFTPNAFSPDGDGLNDVYLPVISGSEMFKYELSIMDRQGNLIFETDDINQGWDGKVNGKLIATTSVFIWLIITEDEYGNKQKRIGNLTLKR